MSPKLCTLGWALALIVAPGGDLMAQIGGEGATNHPPVKPTGPAAKKADDLIPGVYRTHRERDRPGPQGGRAAPCRTARTDRCALCHG